MYGDFHFHFSGDTEMEIYTGLLYPPVQNCQYITLKIFPFYGSKCPFYKPFCVDFPDISRPHKTHYLCNYLHKNQFCIICFCVYALLLHPVRQPQPWPRYQHSHITHPPVWFNAFPSPPVRMQFCAAKNSYVYKAAAEPAPYRTGRKRNIRFDFNIR